jgi:phosphate transport system ATP-binding protein
MQVMKQELRTESLSAFYGAHCAIRDITMTFRSQNITALIGPSGCGKSTLLRCLNRMHEVVANTSVSGRVILDDGNVYDSDVDTTRLRQRIGMVFQRPNPFPTMSILDNALAGVRLAGSVSERGRLMEIA